MAESNSSLTTAEELALERRRIEWNRSQQAQADQPLPQRRTRVLHALRQRIDELVAHGWSISGRDPVRLERGSRVLLVRFGGLIDG
nr:hypothetical protein [uncultured Pseudomonas sp.]